MKQTIVVIGNPIAGSGALNKIKKTVSLLEDKGLDVRLMLTSKKGDAELFATEIGREESKEGALIIVAGGDGTCNEVINGIAGTEISIAILPLGTTNVIAKELNIPEDVEKALDIALNGNEHKICLGRITLPPHPPLAKGRDDHSSLITRYFLLMAGIGYDGQTVYGIKDAIKRFSGKGAYIMSGLSILLRWNPDKLTFNIDGKHYEGYSAIICNASKYAGNYMVAPDAKLENPYLYAFIMRSKRRADIVRYVTGIITGKHLKFDDIIYLRAEKIEIQGNAHIQIDGDYLGRTPAKISVEQDALKIVY